MKIIILYIYIIIFIHGLLVSLSQTCLFSHNHFCCRFQEFARNSHWPRSTSPTLPQASCHIAVLRTHRTISTWEMSQLCKEIGAVKWIGNPEEISGGSIFFPISFRLPTSSWAKQISWVPWIQILEYEISPYTSRKNITISELLVRLPWFLGHAISHWTQLTQHFCWLYPTIPAIHAWLYPHDMPNTRTLHYIGPIVPPSTSHGLPNQITQIHQNSTWNPMKPLIESEKKWSGNPITKRPNHIKSHETAHVSV